MPSVFVITIFIFFIGSLIYWIFSAPGELDELDRLEIPYPKPPDQPKARQDMQL